jgi:subtilase family serine protease
VGWPKTTTLKLDLPFCTSQREVRIKVDSDNDVEESDEANNTFSLIWPEGETITIIKERK